MALRSYFPSASRSQIDVNFLKDLAKYDASKPYHVSGFLPEDLEILRTNIEYQTLHHLPLFNLRGHEHNLSIDKHGFEIIQVPADVTTLDVRGTQKQEYIEELTEIVRERLYAPFALCYDSRVCRTSSEYVYH